MPPKGNNGIRSSYIFDNLSRCRYILEIISYYDEQQVGLSLLFFKQISAAIKLINSTPFIFQIRYKNVRQALVKKFPFQLHYVIDKNKQQVVIIAVTHSLRNPQIWKKRI